MGDHLQGLRATLRVLREQEGEVLREAGRRRGAGAESEEVAALTAEAERLRARINATLREIEELQLH